MPLPAIFRTSIFRLTVLYVVLFGISAAVLGGFIYLPTVGYLKRQTDEVIETEINALREEFERVQNTRGPESALNRLREMIDARGRPAAQRGVEWFSYMLLDPGGRKIAGNLEGLPTTEVNDGWTEFEIRATDGQMVPVRARLLELFVEVTGFTAPLPSGQSVDTGFRILVGREIRELSAINQRFIRGLTLGLGLTLLVAFAGGLALAISAQRRVVEMSRATRNIIAGDLSQRLPVIGHDEHADLAKSVNSMLDQIEHLMGGLRHVGDSIAHDLRGPLTRLRTRLEALAAEPAPSRQSVEQCLAQADGVLATFNALLRIARVESGAYRRAFANVDLGPIAADVAELYEATAEQNLVEIRHRIADNCVVFGDRELLAQALTNLVDNALKYTPVGGHIDLEVKRAGDHIVVVVADSGPGIPAEARERVLQRFARLDESRSKPGNGLGLALVRAVSDQHEGKLVLSDNAPGLRVTMTLPAAR